MSLELERIPSKLVKLAANLVENTALYTNLQKTIEQARDLSEEFTSTIKEEGREVLLKKSCLSVQSNPSKVDIGSLKEALRTLTNRLTALRDQMFVLQGNVHQRIGECIKENEKNKANISLKELDIWILNRQISDLESEITRNETEAESEEISATNDEAQARYLSDRADRHRIAGVLSCGVSLGIGLLSAPFTGGLSLALGGGAAIGSLGGHMFQAEDYEKDARSKRASAASKRQRSSQLRDEKSEKQKTIYTKESEIATLKRAIAKLNETSEILKEVERQLCQAIAVMDSRLARFQDLEITLFDADKYGDAFKVIQNAVQRKPDTYEGRAQIYLQNLKEKWDAVEGDLMLCNTNNAIQQRKSSALFSGDI